MERDYRNHRQTLRREVKMTLSDEIQDHGICGMLDVEKLKQTMDKIKEVSRQKIIQIDEMIAHKDIIPEQRECLKSARSERLDIISEIDKHLGDSKMKEPLKNKSGSCYQVKEDDSIWYNHQDIKSAVEWLKEKCYRQLIDGSMETRDNLNTFDMHELINEAFEDVTK